MENIIIDISDSGQRLDKYLKRYFSKAPGSFIYKMLRKKNITLNEKKAFGSEIINNGDKISLFLSDETIEKFRDNSDSKRNESVYHKAFRQIGKIDVVYEDEDIVILNKPVGLLSQKSKDGDISVNEWLIGYLLEKGEITEKSLSMFKPSVCHRLDRNTGGLIICGKNYKAQRRMSELIKSRDLRKFYICAVSSRSSFFLDGIYLEGYLKKDKKKNTAIVTKNPTEGSDHIITGYRMLTEKEKSDSIKAFSLPKALMKEVFLEAELITGKSHQIRAQLSSEGLPLIGDAKYMDKTDFDLMYKKYGIKTQVLYAYKIQFPHLADSKLSNKVVSVF